ncbi:hypothetical protein AB0I22_13440 [Streptomyces sp. NPDC050610]|uniref:hypothetical protein n=1 Tax=Streptomyces sp. NPDC050610 TaxID=3157097 RepID=UPI00343EE364
MADVHRSVADTPPEEPDAGRGAAPRAWGWVFGAREVDEPEHGPALYTDFEKDWDAQLALIHRWAERNGYARPGYDMWSVLRPSGRIATFLRSEGIRVLVIPGAGIRDRMRDTWEDWPHTMAELESAGVVVEIAD